MECPSNSTQVFVKVSSVEKNNNYHRLRYYLLSYVRANLGVFDGQSKKSLQGLLAHYMQKNALCYDRATQISSGIITNYRRQL